MVNTKMFCWITNVSNFWRIELKVKTTATGTYAIKKTFFSCLDDRIYILKNGYGGLTFGY